MLLHFASISSKNSSTYIVWLNQHFFHFYFIFFAIREYVGVTCRRIHKYIHVEIRKIHMFNHVSTTNLFCIVVYSVKYFLFEDFFFIVLTFSFSLAFSTLKFKLFLVHIYVTLLLNEMSANFSSRWCLIYIWINIRILVYTRICLTQMSDQDEIGKFQFLINQ